MTIKDLSYFLQVCRSGSINGAARSLYISAQGLSRILKNLEDELGYEDVDEAVNTYSHGALERYLRLCVEHTRLRQAVERLECLQRGLRILAKDAVSLIGKIVQLLETPLQVADGAFALRVAAAVLQRFRRGGGGGRLRRGGVPAQEQLLVCVLDDAVLAPGQKQQGGQQRGEQFFLHKYNTPFSSLAFLICECIC